MTDEMDFLDDATRPEPPRFENLTLAQRAPGRHLSMIHGHFRQHMAELRELIEKVGKGDAEPEVLQRQAEASPLLDNYRRFGNLCGQHCQIIHIHHSIEDQSIFPHLSTKSAAMKKVVERLVAEHEIVHQLLVRLVEALGDLVRAPGASTFAAVLSVYETLEKVLLSHFGYEEEAIGDALGVYEVDV